MCIGHANNSCDSNKSYLINIQRAECQYTKIKTSTRIGITRISLINQLLIIVSDSNEIMSTI